MRAVGACAGRRPGLLVDVIKSAEIAETQLPYFPAPDAHGRVLDPGVVEPARDHALEQRLEDAREIRHVHPVGAGDAAALRPEIVELDLLIEHQAELSVLEGADQVGRLHEDEAERGGAQPYARQLVYAGGRR